MIDPAFDMPFNDYQQVGSFIAPIVPPTLGPLDGTLVSLPCINPDWLRILLGCVDQLRNPSSWKGLTDSATLAVLYQVEQLRGALQVGNPCCNVAMRLQGCVLQFSTDGGTTWTDVTNWSADIAACAAQWVASQAPPNPKGSLTNQRACDIAGWLANQVIKLFVQYEVSAISPPTQPVGTGWDALKNAFPDVIAVENQAWNAFSQLYNVIISGTLAHWSAAESDATLWSAVTCAIYNAIKNDGYVTPSNWLDVFTNISHIVYSPSDIIPGLTLFVAGLGATGMMGLQQTGAIDDVDCTGCGTWCHYDDFSTGLHGWTLDVGTQVMGVGINQVSHSGVWWAQVHNYGLPINCTPTDIVINYTSDANGLTQYRKVNKYVGGSFLSFFELNEGTWPSGTSSGDHGLSDTLSGLDIVHRSIFSGVAGAINGIKLHGNGPNPFGVDNCTYP